MAFGLRYKCFDISRLADNEDGVNVVNRCHHYQSDVLAARLRAGNGEYSKPVVKKMVDEDKDFDCNLCSDCCILNLESALTPRSTLCPFMSYMSRYHDIEEGFDVFGAFRSRCSVRVA
jgi:hypothetical protein